MVKPIPWERHSASSLAVMGLGMRPDWNRHGPAEWKSGPCAAPVAVSAGLG